MNKLKTSTKVLIVLAASTLILSIVLLLNIPEPWVESFKETHSFMIDGSFQNYDSKDGERFHSFHNYGFNRNYSRYPGSPHHFGGILFLGLIILLIFKGRRFHGRKNHSRAIVDELFAEEKITEEEYRRRRAVIEEEGK